MYFLKAFINDPGAIGAISPSSQVLAKAMLDDLSLQAGDGILELGPGTGAFTIQIRQRLADAGDYLGVERNALFARLLGERFPELRVVNGLAENVYELYQSDGLRQPKLIVCGLPLSIQRRLMLDSLVALLDGLMVGGSVFRTFFYVHSYWLPSAVHFRRKMNAVFGSHPPGRLVLRNLPPAMVLTWVRH